MSPGTIICLRFVDFLPQLSEVEVPERFVEKETEDVDFRHDVFFGTQ
jgi:hypothetical protein